MKIIHQRKKCIGCASCVNICPNLFKMAEDGKASFLSSEAKHDLKTEEAVLEIKDSECAEEAVDACPVQCIIMKHET